MRKYIPATFQPTIRQDWAGILSYISDQEKAEILTAIFKYPNIECKSKFWLETIKPDLDLQYENFKRSCEAKSRGIRNRWGKISITDVEDMNNTCNTDVIDAKSKSKSKSIGIGKNIEKDKNTENGKIYNNFIPPTEQEILEYAKQMDMTVGMGGFECCPEQAKLFFAYYDKVGWLDKEKIPITDWKKSFKYWVRRDDMQRYQKEQRC